MGNSTVFSELNQASNKENKKLDITFFCEENLTGTVGRVSVMTSYFILGS